MKKTKGFFHKTYLVAQALVLGGGAIFCGLAVYAGFDDVGVNAHIRAVRCVQAAVGDKAYLGNDARAWVNELARYIENQRSPKRMKSEADRITKACSQDIAVDVSEETGEVSVWMVTKTGGFKPAFSHHPIEGLLVILGLTAFASILLFVLKKWLSIVFRAA